MNHLRIIVEQYGGADQLRVVEEPVPEPRAGEVRVRVHVAGVALPDVLARQGIHPETPLPPFTPGWDLVGEVDALGAGVEGVAFGQRIAAMPIHGAYTQYICLPARDVIPVPPGLDAAEAVSLVLNYITAYQMLHRCASPERGARVLIHGASGGVGTALLQLCKLVDAQMYGTCSPRNFGVVTELGGIPLDYNSKNLEGEIERLTGGGVDIVFDPVGGTHLWQSRRALRPGGRVVGYGLMPALRGNGLAASRPGRRERFRGTAQFARYIALSWILPGRKRVVPYSIQTLMRLKRDWFRRDLTTLLELLREQKIKPIVAHRFRLTEARTAHDQLEKGGVIGKFVLLCRDTN